MEQDEIYDENMSEYRRRTLQHVNDADFLPYMSMTELYDTVYTAKKCIIENLLYAGTYILAGAPKIGKSFLAAQLAYHVSNGLPIWGRAVYEGTVLYLALEDPFQRLQDRLYRMFGADNSEKLKLAIWCHPLGGGLEKQLKGFVNQRNGKGKNWQFSQVDNNMRIIYNISRNKSVMIEKEMQQ